MRATGGDQAKCAAKMDAIRARATNDSSATMEKCMEVTRENYQDNPDRSSCRRKTAATSQDRKDRHTYEKCLGTGGVGWEQVEYGQTMEDVRRKAWCKADPTKVYAAFGATDEEIRMASPLGLEPGTSERGEKASPLCTINPRHLTKKAKKARKNRCR